MTYEEALAEAARKGVSHCTDPALMATICRDALPITIGAIAPQLVWEGAQKQGLTTKQLVDLAAKDVFAVSDLMWL
jgi:hypothetical protein